MSDPQILSQEVDLRQGDEDPAEAQLVDTVNNLINGKIDPPSAAKVVDKVISDECRSGVARYDAASAEERESVNTSSIGGWQKFLYVDLIATGAMVIPADQPAQGKLVQLVQELNRLPRHTVPRILGDGTRVEKELWLITPEKDYDGLRQWLWEIIEGGAKPYGKEYDTRYYVNLSAFLARMLASGTAAMTGLCALLDPFARRSLATVASQDPAGYAHRVAAAAQWVLHAGEAVREMCLKRALAGKRWTPELWAGLREKFESVASDARFTDEGCAWARRAGERMREIEKMDVGEKDGVVEVFHFETQADE